MQLSDHLIVQSQYANSTRLETRISIHEKYSRNQQPFGDWICSHYSLKPGHHVLEIGCGTGSMWANVRPPEDCHVKLTDLSPGMLETAKVNTAHLKASYVVCDAMSLPFEDNTFDIVIANMMLYHVPDIAQALKEIRRVLKPEGRFYAATFGEHGAVEAILAMLELPCSVNHRFTLQNGHAQLAPYFQQVELYTREDALDITNLNDLIAYLRSMSGMTVLADIPDKRLLDVFSLHTKNGVLSLPKEYGLFHCSGLKDG